MIRPLLVTGFEPFGGASANPSADVARALRGRVIGGTPVVAEVLPCTFAEAPRALHAALRRHRPALVLALGLAADRTELSLERVAINLIDARIADNAGAQPIDVPVAARQPAARFTTLPIKAVVAALRDAGHPASVSHSAGTFVCNQIFYLLQQATQRRRGVRSGFMHLPNLPPGAMVEGVAIALAAALAGGAGPRTSEGTLN